MQIQRVLCCRDDTIPQKSRIQNAGSVWFNRSSTGGISRLIKLKKLPILLSEMSEASEDGSNDTTPDIVPDMSDVLDSNIQPYSCESSSSLSHSKRGTNS